MKRCSTCGETKPPGEFSRHRGRADGLSAYCRSCASRRFAVWYAANREKQIADVQRRYRNDPVARAAYHRRWYRRNAEAVRARTSEYAATHPKQGHANTNRRRARKKAAPGDSTAQQIRNRWDYYGGRCWMCGGTADTIDHVIPLSRGGANWPANLRPACRSCNSSKHTRTPREMVA